MSKIELKKVYIDSRKKEDEVDVLGMHQGYKVYAEVKNNSDKDQLVKLVATGIKGAESLTVVVPQGVQRVITLDDFWGDSSKSEIVFHVHSNDGVLLSNEVKYPVKWINETITFDSVSGGYISLVSVDKISEGTSQNTIDYIEYVTLEQFIDLGFGIVYDGLANASTGIASPMDDMTTIVTRKNRSLIQDDVDKINKLLNRYEINTKERIVAFFAEISAETSNGLKFLETAGTANRPFVGDINRENLNKWFDGTEYGSKYRGGGAIQLTWDYHYEGFEEWMSVEFGINDSKITGIGAEYVALNYGWEAAAFFWDNYNLNTKADTGDIHNVTYVVNSQMSTYEYELRENAYNRWMDDYVFPSK